MNNIITKQSDTHVWDKVSSHLYGEEFVCTKCKLEGLCYVDNGEVNVGPQHDGLSCNQYRKFKKDV